uniref:Helix-turn-helix domain containing protein n=1 Tax=Roseihalotalea indica TaxID=2867963 RepID=A0AA49GM70_9BACT|nr:helix-turn-helix domain containing protein [Tunicatimonas sp. TK19036]
MIRIQFKEQDVQALRYERFHNPSARVQQKMEALYLKSKGLPHNEICRICEISKTTLIAYMKEYKRGGIKKLKEGTKYKGRTKQVKSTTMGFADFLNEEETTHRQYA